MSQPTLDDAGSQPSGWYWEPLYPYFDEDEWAGPIPLTDAELDDAIVRLVRLYPGRLGRPRIAHILAGHRGRKIKAKYGHLQDYRRDPCVSLEQVRQRVKQLLQAGRPRNAATTHRAWFPPGATSVHAPPHSVTSDCSAPACHELVPSQPGVCQNQRDVSPETDFSRRIGPMTDAPLDQPSDWRDTRPLSRWERWTTDWNGQPIVEWDTEAHARWCEKWAPACPDGNPQRLRHPLGFRERNIGELELRVALGGDDRGLCQLIVDEQDDEVYVRVLVCYDDDDDDDDDEAPPAVREYVDCPVRVWLECPLGERAVIDVDTDKELPLYTPLYVNNVRQPDHGYRPANRRRR